jgi:pantoate--beta-alanine ligase
MDVITGRDAMRRAVEEHRRAGRRVALVPTMGALHEGHLALVDAARGAADVVVMSVFVNPLQFRPGEDFSRYPRPFAADCALAASRGVDHLFAPSVEEMYGEHAEVRVLAGETASRWEGAHRPGHFDGVLTVVAKLFHIVPADVACFGRKDLQQVTLIRRMVADLDFPVRIAVVPTVRDPDGLALSSRNAFLSAEGRHDALALAQSLFAIRAAWERGVRDTADLEATGRAVLEAVPGVVTDYLAVVDPERLAPVATAEAGAAVVVAARVGGTRLIDNTILGDPSA